MKKKKAEEEEVKEKEPGPILWISDRECVYQRHPRTNCGLPSTFYSNMAIVNTDEEETIGLKYITSLGFEDK